MNDIKAWYLELSDEKKQVFLALVSNHLTIHGRFVGLTFFGEEQIEAFKGLNELQHQISGHIVAIGLEKDRYPDDVLWTILEEKATQYQVSPALEESFQFARSRSCWAKPS
jgi:hypothetical protein